MPGRPTPFNAQSLYFGAEHRLASSSSQAGIYNQIHHSAANGRVRQVTPESADSYISDPAHPVPYIATASQSIRRDNKYMIADQRFAAERADVLTYKTEPMAQDMTVAGPITADLFVSTSGTDADWIVKIDRRVSRRRAR